VRDIAFLVAAISITIDFCIDGLLSDIGMAVAFEYSIKNPVEPGF